MWTDAVQMAIVMIGTFVIAIIGADRVGGPSKVWDIVKEDNRINFDTYASTLSVYSTHPCIQCTSHVVHVHM